MKYVCEFELEKGFGNTTLEAFEDLGRATGDYINPEQCTFYKVERIQVRINQEITITEKV